MVLNIVIFVMLVMLDPFHACFLMKTIVNKKDSLSLVSLFHITRASIFSIFNLFRNL